MRGLTTLLQEHCRAVHPTAEPSTGPIGQLARELTDTLSGAALACLYAADRFHHLSEEVLPRRRAGDVVISDRYLASGLVMQQLDGLDPEYLWRINADVVRPDLTVLLDAEPAIVAARLRQRGAHNRLQRLPSSSHVEWHHYRQVGRRLTNAGWPVLIIECSRTCVEEVVDHVYDRVANLSPS